MVNVTQAAESSYLNADIVRESNTKKLVIIDEGKYEEGDYNGKKYLKFSLTIEIDGKQKTWCPNKDSVRNIMEEFGTDSNNWVGQLVKVSVGKSNGKDTVNGMPIVTVKKESL